MIKTIPFILLVILCLFAYTLWVKKVPPKEEPQTPQTSERIEELQESQNKNEPEAHKPIPSKNTPLLKDKKPVEPKDKVKGPTIELKYYNLSLEKDYNEYYNNDKKIILEQNVPPLSKEDVEEKSDLNINLTPEINYNKETREITIDGVQIQLEKKF